MVSGFVRRLSGWECDRPARPHFGFAPRPPRVQLAHGCRRLPVGDPRNRHPVRERGRQYRFPSCPCPKSAMTALLPQPSVFHLHALTLLSRRSLTKAGERSTLHALRLRSQRSTLHIFPKNCPIPIHPAQFQDTSRVCVRFTLQCSHAPRSNAPRSHALRPRSSVLRPSARFCKAGHSGSKANGASCFTYEPPPGVTWTN